MMNKITQTLILSGTLCSLLATTVVGEGKSNIDVHTDSTFDSKIVTTLTIEYLKQAEILNQKHVNGDDYLWYETEKGWVNVPYLIKGKGPLPVAIASETSSAKQEAQEVAPAPVAPLVQETSEPSKEEVEVIQEPVVIMEEESTQEEESYVNYFVGIALNYNSLSVHKDNQVGDIILNNTLYDSATSTNLQIGSKIDNYVVTLNYEAVNLDDIKLATTYLSLDYSFNTFLNPFIGVSLGMSDLEWEIDPLVNSQTRDEKLSSVMYGAQAGIEYNFYKHWSIYSVLSYQKYDFETSLISTPAKATIYHDDKSSIGLGVRYFFYPYSK